MQTIDGVMPRPSFEPRRQLRDIGPPPSPRGPSMAPTFRPLPRPVPVVAPVVAPPVAAPSGVITLPSLPSLAANNLHIRKRSLAPDKSVLVAMAVTAAAMLATRQPFGQVLVLLYGVFAVQRRVPSRVTFFAALGTLAIACILLVGLGGQNGLPGVFATYTFLLLVIGVVSIGRELRADDK